VGADVVTRTLWPEAVVPPVSEEREQMLRQEAEKADWDYDRALDELDEPMLEMKERLMGEKKYMRK
jgi:hypothetical protein